MITNVCFNLWIKLNLLNVFNKFIKLKQFTVETEIIITILKAQKGVLFHKRYILHIKKQIKLSLL